MKVWLVWLAQMAAIFVPVAVFIATGTLWYAVFIVNMLALLAVPLAMLWMVVHPLFGWNEGKKPRGLS